MSSGTSNEPPVEMINVDPAPVPVTNVAEYGFEGRFEERTENAHFFEDVVAADTLVQVSLRPQACLGVIVDAAGVERSPTTSRRQR